MEQETQENVFFERHKGAAFRPLPQGYKPRRPEKTPLYEIVHNNLETMLAEACDKTEHGFGYPKFIEKDFRRYIDCGRLERGFVRIKCEGCGHERLLAFSCKARICPSCHARRVHDTAERLIDHVLPEVDYRQWVFTVPRPLRYLMAKDKKVLRDIVNIFIRTVFCFQRNAAKKDGYDNVLCGSISFLQKFGGALNSNLHIHSLIADGVFIPQGPEEKLLYLPLVFPEQKEVEHILKKIIGRVDRYLSNKSEELFEEETENALAQSIARSIQTTAVQTMASSDPKVLTKILSHLKLPTSLPSPLPAKLPQQMELDEFNQDVDCADEEVVYEWDAPRQSRAPPFN